MTRSHGETGPEPSDIPDPEPSERPEPPALRPMLATPGSLPTRQTDWGFEVKWDGMRALAQLTDRQPVRLWSRSGREVSGQYPEFAVLGSLLPAGTEVVLDAEIVALGADGRPSFGRLQERMSLSRPAAVAAAVSRVPLTLVVFDLLWLDGRRLTPLPYLERRERLADLTLEHPQVWTPPNWTGTGAQAWEWTRGHGLEGLIAKRLDSPYRPGVRSRDWIKVKHVRTLDVAIVGWVPNGPRATACQALLLGRPEPQPGTGGGLRYVGRVGTGFTERDRTVLAAQLRPLGRDTPPFTGDPRRLRHEIAGRVRWVRPELGCEVEYVEETAVGNLRHPVWRGMREPPRTET